MQSPNRFYYTWRLLCLHHSFAWCFFFYLSFLFPPVEPGVFNCCVTSKKPWNNQVSRLFMELLTRFELVTSSLPRMCSTDWAIAAKWRLGTGSNRRPLACQASVLTSWTTEPYGRGSGSWTLGTRFWRPLLYQLSYTPISLRYPQARD